MLTLEPAFAADQRSALIDKILHEEPTKPRQIDPRIPRDLETIALKAIAKDPSDRYRTASELAEDLRRYLADRPILARRASALEQARRWCRRNPGLATASIGAALLTVILLIGSIVAAWTFRTQRDQIRHADRMMRENLFNSLEAQARATRFSHQVGQRFESLRALEHATRIARELKLAPRPSMHSATRRSLAWSSPT